MGEDAMRMQVNLALAILVTIPACSPQESTYRIGSACYRGEFKTFLRKNAIAFIEKGEAIDAAAGQAAEFSRAADQFRTYMSVGDAVGRKCE